MFSEYHIYFSLPARCYNCETLWYSLDWYGKRTNIHYTSNEFLPPQLCDGSKVEKEKKKIRLYVDALRGYSIWTESKRSCSLFFPKIKAHTAMQSYSYRRLGLHYHSVLFHSIPYRFPFKVCITCCNWAESEIQKRAQAEAEELALLSQHPGPSHKRLEQRVWPNSLNNEYREKKENELLSNT